MMITLLTNFLKASSIVGALSIGLSVPGLWLYRKRPACDWWNASCCSYRSVWYYKTVALLGCCSILRNIMSSRILTSDVIGIDVLYTIIMLCWRSQRAAQWRYSLIMRLPFMP